MKKRKFIIASLLSFTLVGLIACSQKNPSPKAKVRVQAETVIKNLMVDSSNFSSVKFEVFDSVLYSDNIALRKAYFNRRLKVDREQLKESKEHPSFESLTDKIELKEEILTQIDELEEGMGSRTNEVASYTYLLVYSESNADNQFELDTIYVQTKAAPNFEILYFTDQLTSLIESPNDFPGYTDMIEEISR